MTRDCKPIRRLAQLGNEFRPLAEAATWSPKHALVSLKFSAHSLLIKSGAAKSASGAGGVCLGMPLVVTKFS